VRHGGERTIATRFNGAGLLTMSEPVRARLRAWADRAEGDARAVVDTVRHRARYGSPPLTLGGDEIALAPGLLGDAKQERIFRRRALLGLESRPWEGRR
jgi:hypothetical protein